MLSPDLHPRPAARASYPPRPGNSLHSWIDGAPTLRRIAAAVEEAQHSVWLSLAFAERDAELPGSGETLFDLLERAAARGIDVRLLCWREPRLAELDPGSTCFAGDAADREFLGARAPNVRIRWDRLPGGYCHHQKSWLIDAGETSECAFVGGLNLVAQSYCEPGYAARPEGNAHDLTLEIRGPAATDVHHNFAQRWNEASERDAPDGCWPDTESAAALQLPSFASRPQGSVPVQITRTLRPKLLSNETPPPGAKPFAVAEGEQSALEQYVSAIAAAEHTVYLENQTIASPVFVDELRRALVRGVRVVYLVSGSAHPALVAARRDPRAAPFFEQLAELATHERFTLAALCASRGDGRYEDIPVHAKVAIVDDSWSTVGSTNVAVRSFRHDSELNATFWDADHARKLRQALFANALGRTPAEIAQEGAAESFDRYRETARVNSDRRALWEALDGFAVALDPAQYGA